MVAAVWYSGWHGVVRRRPSRRAAFAALALAVAMSLLGSASPTRAAEEPPMLVVRGEANHGVTWDLAEPITLNLEFARSATTGRVLGIAIENAERTEVLAVSFEAPELRMTPEGDTPPPPATWATRPEVRLQPGSYYLRLIGDGSGTFDVPVIAGSPGEIVVRESSDAATITWNTPALSAPLAAAVRDATPISLPANGAAIYAISGHTDAHAASPYLLCLRPDPGTCGDADGELTAVGVTKTVAAQRVWWRASFQVLAGRDLAAGQYAGETTWLVGGASTRFDEVAVVVAPSR